MWTILHWHEIRKFLWKFLLVKGKRADPDFLDRKAFVNSKNQTDRILTISWLYRDYIVYIFVLIMIMCIKTEDFFWHIPIWFHPPKFYTSKKFPLAQNFSKLFPPPQLKKKVPHSSNFHNRPSTYFSKLPTRHFTPGQERLFLNQSIKRNIFALRSLTIHKLWCYLTKNRHFCELFSRASHKTIRNKTTCHFNNFTALFIGLCKKN